MAKNLSLIHIFCLFGVSLGLENFQTHQFPLRDGGLIDQELLGRILGRVLFLETIVDLATE